LLTFGFAQPRLFVAFDNAAASPDRNPDSPFASGQNGHITRPGQAFGLAKGISK
jgi:hypothetical protein